MERTVYTILSLLEKEHVALSSAELARRLQTKGIDLSERTVRYYLRLLETKGYAIAEKKRGRQLTEAGRQELTQGFLSERVGFAINRIATTGRSSPRCSRVPSEK